MGMAQQLKKPVILVCTSGSAALNYAPAVAEAYFQQIPLILITADRPPEWIDQWDGQTIRQEKIYGQHIKKDFRFPDDFSHKDKTWHAHRICNEAINSSMAYPSGPVHLNIPFREPFYPETTDKFDYSQPLPIIDQLIGSRTLSMEDQVKLKNTLDRFSKILIVPGQQIPCEKTQQLIKELTKSKKAVVVTDSISNMQSENTVNFHDLFLPLCEPASLSPDLIISFGKSIISKSLKLFLRKSGAEHWHVQPDGYTPDTYQSLNKQVYASPISFLEFLNKTLQETPEHFFKAWYEADKKLEKQLTPALKEAGFGEWKALQLVLQQVPEKSKLHLANSMAVRYVNFLGPRKQEIICNRGTSGIDGSNSTAVGCTFTTKEFVTLITGDMAFFYDRNAFWHNYPYNNLRIILLNNHAGGIFRIIDGPSRQPELEEFFETKQSLTAENLAKDFKFEHFNAKNEEELSEALQDFYLPSIHPKILEIHSDSKKNTEILKGVKEYLKAGF
ncbi:2-succinyl-5-enolpyruvyl-6-hydroxy-3-cyclohexene-1-carboxylic-acid synthase [Echinicola sediminis]